ncbi:alpha/beta fold hydrolase [Pseudooceanicola sp. CBS1P-1]|uniref:Alpha/beta fold hydrolase n=1 Tax=Pseudooceanicola albus TaxID=2692189 RepID=A0A6L7G0Q4_9RHOB|nr:MULTISPECIES: alpha/beta fold hydrolase [Pseudooceanicola]MBT9383665.1 alpha/beta fold hydrolase [Pseudooceanicola endophyticus]MXN17519.1 alpha/beta fold hydrolase [Pseudooceanicola albus]
MRPERLILLHGAWAGGWVWDGLVPALAARGRKAVAAELPGNGHHPIPPEAVQPEDYLETLKALIGEAPGPVAILGHSGGGMLVSAALAAFPKRISQAIWLAGMLLPEGRSFDDLQEEILGPGKRFGITPHVVHEAGGRLSRVPPDQAVRHFFQDAPPEVATRAAARLSAQPAAGHRLSLPRGPGFQAAFDAVPKLYILAQRDRSVLPEAQRRMSTGHANLTRIEIDSDHVPQLSRPEALADLLDRWLP